MHRTFRVPRSIGWWSLFALLMTLHVGMPAVSAQNPLPPGLSAPALPNPTTQHIELAVGGSRVCQMTSRADLKRVENPNSRVVRVERIPNKNNEILLVAENPGRSTITFVDQADRVEVHEVVVAFQEGAPETLELKKGEIRTIALKKVALGGGIVTVGNIIKLTPAPDNPKVWSIEGLNAGKTRLTFFGDAKKTEVVAVFDVDVPFPPQAEDRLIQLRKLIARLAPTAAVEANALSTKESVDPANPAGPKKLETLSVILTGTAQSADEARAIAEMAERLFPPSDLGRELAPAEGAVVQQSIIRSNVINQIRIAGVHTVQLQVVVALVNRSEAKQMSFSWAMNGQNWFASSILGGPFGFTNALATNTAGATATFTPTGAANLPFGVINNNGSFMAFLQALRTEGLSKIISEPRLVTMSGRSANIVSGGQVPILTSGGTGTPTVDYKDFGTKVNFLPIVMGNGKIHIEVSSEISDVDQSLSLNIAGVTPTSIPGFRKRSAQVAVQIEDGQTLAIGGLIQNNVDTTITRVPFLGDLPFIGAAFSSKNFKEKEEELVILVTPRLVDPIDCTKIPCHLPGRETRNPSDFEFFLEGILEAPRGQRNVVFHPTMYRPAFHGAVNPVQYPCNDASCSNRGGSCANCSPSHRHGHATLPTTPSDVTRVAAPMPSFPEITPTTPSVPAIPASRVTVEPELPMVLPPIGGGLGSPTAPRQQDTRPVLPPITGTNR